MSKASLTVLATALVLAWGTAEIGVGQEVSDSMKTGFVEVGETRLYVEEMGQGDPLVMLHGGFLDRRSWDPQVEVVARAHRVVRYDARYHGESTSVPGEYTSFNDLLGVLDGLSIDRAIIMGSSLGGSTALDFAIAYPDRVTALILVAPGASGYGSESPALVQDMQKFFRVLVADGADTAIDYFLGWTVVGLDRVPADVDTAVMDNVRRMAKGSLAKMNSQIVVTELDPPAIGRLHEIQVPTLVVVGAHDQLYVLDLARRVAAEAADAELAVIPGAAHMVNMEQPDAFNEIVLAFLAGR